MAKIIEVIGVMDVQPMSAASTAQHDTRCKVWMRKQV